MTRSAILGTGSYVPEKVLTNADLEKMVDTSDQWIRERTGIRERRVAGPELAASDLGVPAARNALEAAGMDPNDIDLIIFTTLTPDTMCPAAACWLQAGIGANKAAAFDLNAACSGFIYGLQAADAYVRSGLMRNVLLVSVDVMTRVIDWSDRGTCILWGDGAGAVVLGAARDGRKGVIDSLVRSDGREAELIYIAGSGSRLSPITPQAVQNHDHTLKMKGQGTFKTAVRCFTDVCVETLDRNGMKLSDVDVFIPHQANLRIIEAVAKRLRLSMDRIIVTVDKYGNMSSATIPVALDEWVREGRIRRGDHVLMAAFGGGLTWGASLIEW
ncbi:MAG: 3-oxoacyl-ACP synthase [Candidatus Tectomicrobia bacterium RIFCSPLOWO2_12_FULL_69_37]|nr:MAG: 3-oxoacyl-ACP synthase [Candidatus Tectomicrobia bacterium RIFCSPLOWO2_12_FULL_69_37]OGL63480.1 MAG: 3-oxoacyl-ACP synthase [Candidatus Tectomicrobia bacterium RIFCSPLOWO2_02_FULL_70_19]